jgi:hypothetical protein
MREPNIFADCRGVEILRQAGVEVVEIPDLARLVCDVNAHIVAVRSDSLRPLGV